MVSAKVRSEPKSSVKRSWILDKAGALFWQKGYYGTSMRDIASACRCKPANIYNYFESKEDILFEVIRDITARAVLAVSDLKDDEVTPPVEQLKRFVKGHFSMLAGIKRSNVLISDTGLKDLSSEHRREVIALRDEYDLILRRILKRGSDLGTFAVTDEKVVSNMISSVVVRSSIWFSNRGRLSADVVGDMMADFVLRGVRASC